MAFKGMNPEEGAEVAQSITESAQQILDAISSVTSLVNSVEWVGPDYDSYREDWNAFISGAVSSLTEAITAKGQDLSQQAEEQTATSNAG